MVKRNAIATKLTKVCTQTQKWAFDVAVTIVATTTVIVADALYYHEPHNHYTTSTPTRQVLRLT